MFQYHALRAATKEAKGPLVRLGPDLLAGLPDHVPETGTRVACVATNRWGLR